MRDHLSAALAAVSSGDPGAGIVFHETNGRIRLEKRNATSRNAVIHSYRNTNNYRIDCKSQRNRNATLNILM